MNAARETCWSSEWTLWRQSWTSC